MELITPTETDPAKQIVHAAKVTAKRCMKRATERGQTVDRSWFGRLYKAVLPKVQKMYQAGLNPVLIPDRITRELVTSDGHFKMPDGNTVNPTEQLRQEDAGGGGMAGGGITGGTTSAAIPIAPLTAPKIPDSEIEKRRKKLAKAVEAILRT